MLFLQRKVGQQIIIDGDTILEVVEINGKNVKLGFKFPEGRSVLRKEVLDRAKENGDEADLYSKGLL
jgi:carbon storage regulator CsrA